MVAVSLVPAKPSIRRIHSLKMLLSKVWFPQLRMLLRGTMPSDEKMSVDERRKYLKLVAPRYAKAGRVERPDASGLTEMAAVTGLHRQSLLRLLH